MKKVLILSGFDPTGAAGLLLDTKVITHTNNFPVAIPTTLTVQTFRKSYNIIPANRKFVEEALSKILREVKISVVKIGLITPEIAKIVAKILTHKKIFTVWDPVFSASTGLKFMTQKDLIKTYEILFPVIDLITPNKNEASILAPNSDSIDKILQEISQGKLSTLLKGGHLNISKDKIHDFLYFEGKIYEFTYPKINKEVRGTGCFLSSAIASYFATGKNILEAYKSASNELRKAIKQTKGKVFYEF